MEFNSRLVDIKQGRKPGMAGSRVLQGLIRSLNSQLPVHQLTGSMPKFQDYNNNPLSFQMGDEGNIEPWGTRPFQPTPPIKPWTR